MTLEVLKDKQYQAEEERKHGNFPHSLQLSTEVLQEILESKLSIADTNTITLNALFNIARVSYSTGNLALALAKADEAMEILKTHNLPEFHARFLSIYGFINDSLGRFDIALEYFDKVLKIKQNEGDKEGIATVIGNIGNVYYSLGRYDKAIESYTESISYYDKDSKNPSIEGTLGNLGSVYIAIGSYDKALECYESSLHLRTLRKDKSGIAIVLGNIGALYVRLESFSKASEYFNEAIQILQEIGDKSTLAISTVNYAEVFINNKDYTKALELQLQALSLAKEVDDRRLEGHCLVCIGKSYKELGSFSEAMEYFQSSLHLRRNVLKTNDGVASTLMAIGSLSMKQKQYDDAREKLFEALEISTQYGEKALIFAAHKEIAEMYKLQSNWEKSDYHFRLYHQIEKEVQNEDVLNQSQLLEYRRKVEESEKDRQIQLARFQEQEKIFHNIFPVSIANRLIEGESTIAESYENVSIFFSDIVGFTNLSSLLSPSELVKGLNAIFTSFDRIATKYGLEKIKTIGDSYMAVCGVPITHEEHTYKTAKFAIEILTYFEQLDINEHFNGLQIRIGLHCGTVVAGIIGEKKFAYDVWGDAVNIASRMESTSLPNKIHISSEFASTIQQYPEFLIVPRGEISIRGKGVLNTFWLEKGK